METQIIEHDDSVELILKGHLDTKTAKETEGIFHEMGEKYDNVTLDMGGVSYISSAGIRALRDLYMTLYNKKGTLSMVNVGDVVMNVLEMTGLKGLLKLN